MCGVDEPGTTRVTTGETIAYEGLDSAATGRGDVGAGSEVRRAFGGDETLRGSWVCSVTMTGDSQYENLATCGRRSLTDGYAAFAEQKATFT